MAIITSNTKQDHPIASKIPMNLWKQEFASSFDEDSLHVNEKDFVDIQRGDLPENKIQALILLIICYPKASPSQRINFAKDQLDLSEETIFFCHAAMNSIETLQNLADKGQDKLKAMIKAADYNSFRAATANGHLNILKWQAENAPDQLEDMIQADDYDSFLLAAINGHLDILKWLAEMAPEKLEAMIQAADYDSFRMAAAYGHLDICKWLAEKAPDKLNTMIKTLSYNAFREAAAYGHLDTCKWLAEQAPDKLEDMITADDYDSFLMAATNGHLDVCKWLAEQVAAQLEAMIQANGYDAFLLAAANGHLDVCKWLAEQVAEKTPAKLKAMIQEDEYYSFREATANGHLDVCKWLVEQAPAQFEDMIKVADYDSFRLAAANGHLDVCKWLEEKASDQLKATIKIYFYRTFREAAANGHLDVCKWLAEQAPAQFEDMIKAADYDSFRLAAANGHLDVCKWLAEKAPNELGAMIKECFYNAFREAAANGHLDICKWLAEQAPAQFEDMIKAIDYDSFRQGAANGHLNVCKWLAEQVAKKAPDKLEAMIQADKYDAFCQAAANGRMNILKWLAEQEQDKLGTMIKAKYYKTFRKAATNDHLDILKWLAEQAPDKLKDMIQAVEYESFRVAAAKGYLDTCKWLAEKAPDQLEAMINEYNYESFREAAVRGQLDVCKWLAEQAPDQLEAMIQADNYNAFRRTAFNKKPAVTTWLLSHSSCFAYAEQHQQEYGRLITSFVGQRLESLHAESATFEQQNPNGIFDIEPEQARFCFYLIRNLIRRNDRTLDDEIRFLLSIPAVKMLAHQSFTPNNSNELLRLAMACGNQEASALLLSIEAVRELAVQNNYYRDEARDGVDLRHLAQDQESSMVALTTGEAKRLEFLTQRYQPMMQQAGIAAILHHLKDELCQSYEENPASISVGEKQQALPLSHAEFQQLARDFQGTQYKEALKAYYQHPVHTAWRYLSKPNPWMHQHAAYVNVNEERTQRWSTFEDYSSLIALFYLAATDKDSPATTGHTMEGRVDHFIKELALIGRAHNWDRTRVRDGRQEQYDDLEGDRPSCFSGVKRRLFQSVIGHSLLEVLTEEKIEAEIKQFAFKHFNAILNAENITTIKQVLDECCIDLDDTHVDQLEIFNISLGQQEQLLQDLEQKYNEQFSNNPAFIAQVKEALLLDANSPNSRFRYHVLSTSVHDVAEFYEYVEKRCNQLEQINDEFDSLKEFTQEELMALSQKNLSSKQIDNLLAHPAMTSNIADVLFKKPEYNGTIKAWDWMNEEQLLNTADKTKEYDSLKLALRHGDLLSPSRLSEWMKTKQEQHRELLKEGQVSPKIEVKLLAALEDLRIKSFSHAIKAIKEPSYEQAAETSFVLYQALHNEVQQFLVNPEEHATSFKNNCKQAMDAAEPVLKEHHGYKQFSLDFTNVSFEVTALFRNANLCLFESKTDSMNRINKVLGTMEQLIEDNTKLISTSGTDNVTY